MRVLKLFNAPPQEKRCNIHYHLIAKEYCTKSNHRRIHYIMGTLMTKGSYTFQKSWSRFSKKHIACDGRFAFFDNYESCIDCSSPSVGQCVKFTVQRRRPGKIEDALLMEGCPETLNLPKKGYRGSLLAVVKGNSLLRIDLETGQIVEDIYVAPPGVRFKKIMWNVGEESFTLCSTLTTGAPAQRQATQEVTQLVVMSCMALDFVCKLSVTKQVFGRDVVDAMLFLNILTVMHSTHYVRMYSLEWMLDKNRTHSQKLYEKVADGHQFGVYPSHLTHNVQLEEQPPCLFEVRCRNRDVMITMPPCYYIMWPLGNTNGYCCYSFETNKMVQGGLLDAEDCEFEERVSLHADESGRIIHMKNSQIRMLKLHANDTSSERHLVEDFVIDFGHTPEASVPVRISQSGRVIRPRVIEDCSTLMDQVVLTMVYCEDLDMILVASTRAQNGTGSSDLSNHTVVGFYDNWNGSLLRQFMLEESVTETLERSICYSHGTITHIIKTSQGKFECHVYKLQPLLNMQDEWVVSQRREVNNQPMRRRQR